MATKASSRYQSSTPAHSKVLPSSVTATPFDGRSSVSSHHSDSSSTTISSSSERRGSSVKRLVSSLSNRYASSSSPSVRDKNPSSSSARKEPTCQTSAIVATKASDGISNRHSKPKSDHNMTTLVKKFMHNKGKPSASNVNTLVIPADIIAEDLRKASDKATRITSLQKKLLQKVSGKSSETPPSQKKMLTDSKSTRPLSVVLKSEQELLQKNRGYEMEIEELHKRLADKNAEVEDLRSMGRMLKELCSKQQEEMKRLKGAFPTSKVDSPRLHELLERQGRELKQARQVIPNLQEQVTSLTTQLKCLAEGLAEVKADKEVMRAYFDGHIATPKTPVIHQEPEDFKELSNSDPTTPVSQEDMILKDMNPCLTPYYARTKSEEYEVIGFGLTDEEKLAEALQKLIIGSEQKQDVLQEHCLNVHCESGSCSPNFRKLSSEKAILIGSGPDENRLGFTNLCGKALNQKLCWD